MWCKYLRTALYQNALLTEVSETGTWYCSNIPTRSSYKADVQIPHLTNYSSQS